MNRTESCFQNSGTCIRARFDVLNAGFDQLGPEGYECETCIANFGGRAQPD